MESGLKKLIIKYLEEVLDKIKSDTCELSADEASDVLSIIAHKRLSKEDACEFLNCSRPKFDKDLQLGRVPKGRKRRGFNEHVWYEDELLKVLKR